MKYVNVDEVLKILNKYGKYIFVTDMKRYSDMTDEVANLKGMNDNKNELLDYVTESIEAEKKMIGSCHDLASEDYHKGIIYAFECMKMKLM